MNNAAVIVKIQSGVVAEVYSTDSIQIIVVDYDLIEGDETCENRMRKSVLTMEPDYYVKPDEINATVTSLLANFRRPVEKVVAVLADPIV